MKPVYWKPRYATRRMRERAFAKRQLAREASLRGRPRTPSLLERVRRRLRM